jgi:DNA-binding NtrC family response regulator
MPDKKIILTYILEDDKVTSELIAEILKNNDIVDYRIFNSSSDLIANMSTDVHICVLDYFLGETLTGLDVMKIVLAKNPECFVIIISGQDNADVVADFLNNGAKKYVNKNTPKYLNLMVDFVLLAIKEYEKKVMLQDIAGKMVDMQNRTNERRSSKTSD